MSEGEPIARVEPDPQKGALSKCHSWLAQLVLQLALSFLPRPSVRRQKEQLIAI